jgi:hypothetical protein
MSFGFASGTRLRTTRGEVAVEDLKVGDEATTLSGASRPIIRVDQRTIVEPRRAEAPVRVRAGALGDNQPTRDVLLSPDHGVVVKVMDEVLIPVGLLVNGATIAREAPGEVAYWGVELDGHDVILAEGLKTESRLAADEGAPTERARPLVVKGPVIDAARMRLITRAEGLGWTRREDMDLHLMVDGVRRDGEIDGDMARFFFPASALAVVIASRCFVPSWKLGVHDERELGLSLRSLRILDGLRVDREIPLDHPALDKGFQDPERDGEQIWRWTSGAGVLPPSLWEGCRGQAILRVGFNPTGGWSWAAPDDGASADLEVAKLRANR